MITPQSMIHELDLVSTSIVGLQSDLQRLIDTKGDSFENLPKGSVSYMSRTTTSGAGSTEPLPLSSAGLRHALPTDVRQWWENWRRKEVPKFSEAPLIPIEELVFLLRD